MAEPLNRQIDHALKASMRARDRKRTGALRLIRAEIQRVEVDEQREIDDARVLAVLEKMLKQRAESEAAFREAGRAEQAEAEAFEAEVIREFMPRPLDDAELEALLDAAIAEAGAGSMRDMGRVMELLKPRVQGRADMKAISARVRARLGG